MGYSHKLRIIAGLLVSSSLAFGQEPEQPDTSFYSDRITDINPRFFRSHDTVWMYSGICKPLKITMLTGQEAITYLRGQVYGHNRIPFLKVHGSVQYDFTYRSFVDTPFSQKDFAQHSLQATVDLVVRDKYPVRMTLMNRRSNSPYFDDITDVNVQFNRGMFFNNLKEGLTKKIPATINRNKLSETELLYKRKQWEVESLQSWLKHPARLQEIVEEKEKLAGQKISGNIPEIPVPDKQSINGKFFDGIDKVLGKIRGRMESKQDSLVADRKSENDSSVKFKALAKFQQKQSELKKTMQELKLLNEKVKDGKKAIQDSINILRQELAKISDPSALKDFIREHRLDSKEMPKGWQILSAINTIGLGRTWIDYSDLTVKNISLTGINAEMNPSRMYLAFAAGKVNYRFRDFVVKNNDRSKQSLYLLRAGIGRKEGNNFILTWYDGKRNLLNSFGNPSVSSSLEKVIGMSAQSRLQIDPDNYVILEVAKSSFHTTGTVNQDRGELMNKVWNFKDRTNEAYSVRISSYWPQSNTKFTGYYRKMGEHFQSFNLQPVNADQEAYQLKVQQSFLKRKLSLEAGLRKNDFSNPLINPGLTSKTVFKTLQATLRIPKYPFVSVGYYPSSQLTVLDNNVIAENQYNTFSTVISHAYRAGQLSMSSNLVYLKFYNNGADTGFIYYNASSVTLNQYIFWKALQLQSGITLTSQRDLNVLTLEQSVSYQLRNWLTLSGAVKYNRVNHDRTLWGGTGGIEILIKGFGTIQASYDKSFLPGQAQNLLPVDMGRVSYYRTF